MDTLMHELELVAIWFSSVIIGGLLTMLLPRMMSASRGSEGTQDACEPIPAYQTVHRQEAATVPISSKALGTPHVAGIRKTTSQVRAA